MPNAKIYAFGCNNARHEDVCARLCVYAVSGCQPNGATAKTEPISRNRTLRVRMLVIGLSMIGGTLGFSKSTSHSTNCCIQFPMKTVRPVWPANAMMPTPSPQRHID